LKSESPEVGRPWSMTALILLSFYVGIETLLSNALAMVSILSEKDPRVLQEIRSASPFSSEMEMLLITYCLVVGVLLVVFTYLLMIREQDIYRRLIKGILAVDVFAFLGQISYFYHVGFQHPNAQLYYSAVFLTLLEVFLIIGLSHPGIIRYCQSRNHPPSQDPQNQMNQGRR